MALNKPMAKEDKKTPAILAREALLHLTVSKTDVTPENFRIAYEKASGVSSVTSGHSVQWRDLTVEVLELGMLGQFKEHPKLEKITKKLLDQVKLANTDSELVNLNTAFKGYWHKLKKNKKNDPENLNEPLIKLIRLLMENMKQFCHGDKWMDGQINMLSQIVSAPITMDVISDAENNLRSLLDRQSVLKESLNEARSLLKQLAASCISVLSDVTDDTGEYHSKIESYQNQIEQVDDIVDLKDLIAGLKQDTNQMQICTQQAHQGLKETQERVAAAEKLIDQLSLDLDQASQLAYRDFLTGSLNRRGMEEALDREFSRADRTKKPLCLAMLDIDHFKKINDTLGHEAGDEAIMHLATITQMALRPTDVLARFGGEEFLIILPETSKDTGVQVLTRVQRELTKNLFLHDNEKRLITFSAGVSERIASEESDPVLRRIDEALYKAKDSGRNQVIAA